MCPASLASFTFPFIVLNDIFFFSVLEVGDSVFEVLSTSGDTHLGGDDFDKVGHSFYYIFYVFLIEDSLIFWVHL